MCSTVKVHSHETGRALLWLFLCTRGQDEVSDCVAPRCSPVCHTAPLMSIYCFLNPEKWVAEYNRIPTAVFYLLPCLNANPLPSLKSVPKSPPSFKPCPSRGHAYCSGLSGIWFMSAWSDLCLRNVCRGRRLSSSWYNVARTVQIH